MSGFEEEGRESIDAVVAKTERFDLNLSEGDLQAASVMADETLDPITRKNDESEPVSNNEPITTSAPKNSELLSAPASVKQIIGIPLVTSTGTIAPKKRPVLKKKLKLLTPPSYRLNPRPAMVIPDEEQYFIDITEDIREGRPLTREGEIYPAIRNKRSSEYGYVYNVLRTHLVNPNCKSLKIDDE